MDHPTLVVVEIVIIVVGSDIIIITWSIVTFWKKHQRGKETKTVALKRLLVTSSLIKKIDIIEDWLWAYTT